MECDITYISNLKPFRFVVCFLYVEGKCLLISYSCWNKAFVQIFKFVLCAVLLQVAPWLYVINSFRFKKLCKQIFVVSPEFWYVHEKIRQYLGFYLWSPCRCLKHSLLSGSVMTCVTLLHKSCKPYTFLIAFLVFLSSLFF